MRLLSVRSRAGADPVRPAPRAAEPRRIGQHPDLGAAAFGTGAGHARLDGWEPRGALIFVLVGLLFPATVTLLTFEANRRMGPSISGALSNLTPLFAVVVAAFLFDEVPRPLQALGVAMVVIGVITLSVNRDWLGTRWHLGAILLPIGIAGIRPPPSGNRRVGWLWFGCVGACNGLGVLALYSALARGPVLLVSPLVATYPLVTLAFAAILLRSARVTIAHVIGVTTTVAGVMLLVGT